MAYLSGDGDGGTDRGQIILVAAFILAVSFVVLAVVVNSAIFTENLSTRDTVAGSHDALEYRGEVEIGVENLIVSVNQNRSLDNQDVEASLTNVSTQGGVSQSALGRVVDVQYETWEEGIRIAQDNPSRNFTSNDSTALDPSEWTVAENVEQTRNFVINVSNPGSSNLDFTLIANQSDTAVDPDRWEMNVQSDSNTLTVEVSRFEDVTDLLHSEECTRTVDGDSVVIDVTRATVAGEPCHALYRTQSDDAKMWFATDLAEYTIEYEGSESIEGTYSFVIDRLSDVDGNNFGDAPEFPSLQQNGIVYSMTVNYAYYTPAVAYETEIEVAPGELPP